MAVERVEREALALVAAGADLSVHDVLATLDDQLYAPLVRKDITPDELELRRSLGVA